MAKFVLMACMFERSPEERQLIKLAHWRAVLEEAWHPERSVAGVARHPLLHPGMDRPSHASTASIPRRPSSSTPSARHATCNANAVPIEVLQRNTSDVLEVLDTDGHVIGDQLKPLFHAPASPLPTNLILTSTDHVRAFEQATRSASPPFEHGGTALIHVNPLIQAVDGCARAPR